MDFIWKLMGSPWTKPGGGSDVIRFSVAGGGGGRLTALWHLDACRWFWVVGLPASPVTLCMAFSTFLEGWLCLSMIKAGSTDTSGTHQRNPSWICYNSALARSWLETFDVCKRALRAHVIHPFISIPWAQGWYRVSSSESHVSGVYYLSSLQKHFHSVKI